MVFSLAVISAMFSVLVAKVTVCGKPARTLAAVVFVLIMTSGCSGLFFFPDRTVRLTPDELGLGYQDISLTAADGTQLHAWFLHAKQPVRGSVLFLHGNAENISTHIHNVSWLPAAGYQVLLVDYRGFGQSHGKPRLPEVFQDVSAAMTWLETAPETRHHNRYLLGQSIGASLMHHAVLQYASDPRLCGLISDAAFARYSDISRQVAGKSWLTWPFQYPISWVLRNGYDPVDAVARLDRLPILFIHSRDDQIVPFSNLDMLVTAHRGKHHQLVTSGPHTATFADPENRRVLLEFMGAHHCSSR